jgi:hypothetical protein
LIGNWLYGVAYRTALHARDAAVKQRAKESEMVPRTAASEESWARLRLALDQELERLPDKFRAVIVLCDLEGKTRKEAARHLGLPEGTVASRLARAKTILAKRLVSRGVGVPAGAMAALLSQTATASVPTSVMNSTIQAAGLFAAGNTAAAGLVSDKVAALTEGVLKTMLFTKLKFAMSLLLIIALLGAGGAGVAMLTPQAPATNQVETRADEPENPTAPSRTLKGEYKFLSLSFSLDGKSLATVTRDANAEPGDSGAKIAVRLWDVQSGSVKRTVAEDKIKVENTYAGVGLSADGKTVAAPAFGKTFDKRFNREIVELWLVLWDAETGKIRHKLKHGLEVRALGFSPDGKMVASGSGCGGIEGDFESVKLWDLKTGRLLRSLKTKDLEAVKVAFAPDGKLLAVVHDPVLDHSRWSAEVTLWDPALGKSQTLPDSAGVEVIAFSPDGKTLMGAARTKLRVWDVTTCKTIQASDLNTGFSDKAGSALTLSPDGKTLAISGKQDEKHVIALYDVKTAKRTQTLQGGEGLIWPLSFSPDGNTLAGGSSDETIYLWDFHRRTKSK